MGGIKQDRPGIEECRAQVPPVLNHQHLGSQEEVIRQRGQRGKAGWHVMEAKRGTSQGRRQPGGRGKLTAEEERDDLAAWSHSLSTQMEKTPQEGKEAWLGLPSTKLSLNNMDCHRGLRRTAKWKRTFLRIERQLRVLKSKRRIKCKEERTEK